MLPQLAETYCGTIAYELEHLSDHQQRVWLRQAIESGRYRHAAQRRREEALFRRLCEVEGMERFLRKRFLGQKQFSLEGLDVMIPMLDETIELAAEAGAHEVVMGMAHRGRLNVLAHTIGMPYEYILREFEGERTIDAVDRRPRGRDRRRQVPPRPRTARARPRTARSAFVSSRTRATSRRSTRSSRAAPAPSRPTARRANGAHDPSVALAVLLHGDAAFAGQGVVAETFNLHDLEGYSTGGTLHLITNNQIGFTTDPREGRSTRYSSDLAKGFDVPIIHVNADDPEAAIAAVRLAMAYRRRFAQDVVIDLVGYRRFGHNEQDEAAYTQPLMVEQINAHPSVRELYEEQLVEDGVLTRGGGGRVRLRGGDDAARRARPPEGVVRRRRSDARARRRDPALDDGRDRHRGRRGRRSSQLNEELLRTPEEFTVHPKLARQLERRRVAIDEGGIDWGQAEALAYRVAARRRDPRSG